VLRPDGRKDGAGADLMRRRRQHLADHDRKALNPQRDQGGGKARSEREQQEAT